MDTTRRSFLRGALMGAGALALPSFVCGSTEGGKRLILILASGGWDVSYCFDPKFHSDRVDGPELDEDAARPDDEEYLASYGGIDLVLNDAKRPAVTGFFDRWAGRCAVVNGLWIGSIAHPACRIRIMTGGRVESSPDLAAMAGYSLAPDVPIPYMDLGSVGYVGELAAFSGRAGARNQLRALVDRRQPIPAAESMPFGQLPLFVPEEQDDGAIQDFLARRAERFTLERGAYGKNAEQLDNFFESQYRAGLVRAESEHFAEYLELGVRSSLAQQGQLAVQLLQSGLCSTVSLDSRGSWDSHQDNADQHGAYQDLFTGLDAIMNRLQTEGMLEDTVVAVVSEMSRTPRRNIDGGKDHWPITSALVMGAGVAGGRTFGGTDDGLDGLPVDLESGELFEGGIVPRYDHFAAGLLELLGVPGGEWFGTEEVLRGFIA